MAENNWSLTDSPILPVEFEAPAAEKTWSVVDSPLALTQFEAAPAEWANHDWLLGLGMVQAAEAGGGSIDCSVASSQGQGATADLDRSVISSISSSEGQIAIGSLTLSVDSSFSASQGQGASGVFARGVDSSVSSVQAQGSTGLAELAVSSSGTSAQGQTVTLSTASSVDCSIASSQGQGCVLAMISGGRVVGRRFIVRDKSGNRLVITYPTLQEAILELAGPEIAEKVVKEVARKIVKETRLSTPAKVVYEPLKLVLPGPAKDFERLKMFLAEQGVGDIIRRIRIEQDEEDVVMVLLASGW